MSDEDRRLQGKSFVVGLAIWSAIILVAILVNELVLPTPVDDETFEFNMLIGAVVYVLGWLAWDGLRYRG